MDYILGQDNDTIYELPATVTTEGDSVYVSVTKEDIKTLHDRLFTEHIVNDKFMNVFVLVEMAYIPVLFFIIIMVTVVNIRWNRAYKRIKNIANDIQMDELLAEKMGAMKAQKLNLWDRLSVYFVMWVCSLVVDFFLMLTDITQFPFALMIVALYIINRIMKRLIWASKLNGVDDSDIMDNIGEALEGMVIKPIVGSIIGKITGVITKKNE